MQVPQLAIEASLLGAEYATLGWAFSYDRVTTGYLNVAFGDLLILSSIGALLVSRLFPPAFAFMIVLVLAVCFYGLLRLCAHHLLLLPAARGHEGPFRIVLTGLGLALCINSVQQLTPGFRELTWSTGVLHLHSPLPELRCGDVVMRPQDQLVALSVLISCIVLLAAQTSRLGRAFPLLRDNPRLVRRLGLPIGRVRQWNGLAALLLGVLAATSFAAHRSIGPTAGLHLTVFGFLVAVAGNNNPWRIGLVGLGVGLIETVLAGSVGGSMGMPSHWSTHLALVALAIIAFAQRETWRVRLVELEQ